MKRNIREATLHDFEAVARLTQQVQKLHAERRPDIYAVTTNALDPKYYEEIIDSEESKVFVMEEESDGDIIAYSLLKIVQSPNLDIYMNRKVVDMYHLSVDQRYRGQGIGEQLIEHAVSYTKETEADALELGVYAVNEEALSFYKKQGFKPKIYRMELLMDS
ncbi:N-acetyltransferase [Bacillus sp. DX1.1]|uniref:GNAT family N-acetyltransferase n=1 Tax=unclassified Bacillus (in: firmicutes) TaxID=185979 RepID=UPI002570E11E|nr:MULTISPECIES: N-acetyltransferase [unclassified Bacillus (in: firmicutes)]MDM5155527.1 N-acetyltransferase [Bacillus sp. DX1.1]WJE79838.1 N-acetyltransferase [Bacillus sp. DX3.1]